MNSQRSAQLRITIVALGSRGDVQPYAALGAGFRAAGYRVRLATHDEFADLADEAGLEFFQVRGNPRLLLETEDGSMVLEGGINPFLFFPRFLRMVHEFFPAFREDVERVIAGTDAVVYSNIASLGGAFLFGRKHLPGCAAFLQPTLPTREIENFAFPGLPRRFPGRGAYNRVTYHTLDVITWQAIFRQVLKDLGVRMTMVEFVRRSREFFENVPMLYGFSPTVVPKPRDWPDNAYVTGYWFLPRRSWHPPRDLEAFLSAGRPPVYIGFGSMRAQSPEALTDLIVEAVKLSGQRAVLLSGWAGLGKRKVPPWVKVVEQVPHEWLFPRVSAVVHHGGSGTTAAGLRAGKPTVVIPFIADQPFWGRRVHALGAGPRPIPVRQVTAQRLAAAISEAVGNPKIRAAAAAIGQRIRVENGVGVAVQIFKRHLAGLGYAKLSGPQSVSTVVRVNEKEGPMQCGRREFLKRVGLIAVVAVAGRYLTSLASAQQTDVPRPPGACRGYVDANRDGVCDKSAAGRCKNSGCPANTLNPNWEKAKAAGAPAGACALWQDPEKKGCCAVSTRAEKACTCTTCPAHKGCVRSPAN